MENKSTQTFVLPEVLQVPKPWPYGKKWTNKNITSYEAREVIDEMCGISGAADKIDDLFNYIVPRALEKIAIQNSIINQLKSKKINAHNLSKSDVDWQMGNTWARNFEFKSVLFDVYNIEQCEEHILSAINFTWALFEKARRHSEEIIEYIETNKAELEEAKKNERQAALNELKNKSSNANKWNEIDIAHSKIERGFVYVLGNDLMPGVYKIGFTESNPDKRAAEISKKHGLPLPFYVKKYWRTSDPYIVEQKAHKILENHKKAGEFFEVEFDRIAEVLEKTIL